MEELNTNAVIKVIAYDCETGYAVEDDGNIIPCDKVVDYKGRKVIHLPSNSANRQWIDKARTDAAIESDGCLVLEYKASIKIGSTGSKIPNEALVAKYAPELLDEFKSIVNNAIAAKKADAAKPLTELEKAQRAKERAEEKLAKLLAEANGGNN